MTICIGQGHVVLAGNAVDAAPPACQNKTVQLLTALCCQNNSLTFDVFVWVYCVCVCDTVYVNVWEKAKY